jgi:omega-hydroxy-beta-dihydromenaquinone-9 sulfotransferase
MDTLLSRMGAVYRVLRRAHGVRIIPLFIAVLIFFQRTTVTIFMALDRIFFPKLAKTKASRPIVLVGNPRTGTTFLQRFLSDEGFGSGMELFLMLYPSLTLQKLLKPFLPLLEKVSPAKFHSTEAHHTSLTSVETDDVGVLFRYLDGLFLYGFFLSFEDEDLQYIVDPKVRDTSERDFAWLEQLWTRSLLLHGAERNIAKLFSVSLRLPKFMERFPDAHILYMARDPLEVIPSSNSLVIGVLDRAFGFWSKPKEVQERWLERMYNAWVMIFKRFHEDWVNGNIDQSKVFVVRYDRMMADFEGLMADMCKFLEHPVTPELQATFDKIGSKQRGYTSEHKYNLAKYGLSEERIRQDCKFYYDTFLPPATFRQ